MKRAFLLLGAAAGLLVASCGDDEEGTDANSGPVPLSRLLSEATKAQCDYLVRCTWLADSNICSNAAVLPAEVVQLHFDAENGVVGYSEEAARRWIDNIRNQACHFTIAAQKPVEDAFAATFIGNFGEGEACLVNGECSGDLECDTSMCDQGQACCQGVCAAEILSPVGGECEMSGCQDDAYCGVDEMTMEVVCIEKPGSNEQCDGQAVCEDGLLCDLVNSNSCFKLSSPGQECNPTLATPCLDYTTWCDPESETCVPKPKAGEACDVLPCGYAYECVEGVCQAKEVLGAACSNDNDCLADTFCNNGECFPAVSAVACPSPGAAM